jgi:hypothetical protein
VYGFFEAVGDSGVAQPPLAQEGFAPLLDLLWRVGVDHVVVDGLMAIKFCCSALPAAAETTKTAETVKSASERLNS